MRRLVVGAMLAAVIVMTVRKMAAKLAPAMRSKCAETCERMLSNMPESFPPNRMMADLEALKEQTARIIDLVDRPRNDKIEGSSSPRQHSTSGPTRSSH